MDQAKKKQNFFDGLRNLTATLGDEIETPDHQWTVKGFIDVYRTVYALSTDTKVISKILEIHLFPKLLTFAEKLGFTLVLADHQNYYPDLTFIHTSNHDLKFAVDFKTTYRDDNPDFCNGFTLGSHGQYFTDRSSTKNIQFPYCEYAGHFCLGIIYTRNTAQNIKETQTFSLENLQSVASVICDIQFFVQEKWRIASDKRGSGNTANIGSITKIDDIIAGRGMFSALGEEWFDDYWMNYRQITVKGSDGQTRTINNLIDFVRYRRGNPDLVIPKARKRNRR